MTQKIIIGKQEWCGLPELGLPYIKARVDSGAKTSALHAFDITTQLENEKLWVEFYIHPIQKDNHVTRKCRSLVVDHREIKSSSGETELRYVIKTPLILGNNKWEIEITLTNRDSMGYRMLLGREAMADRMLIDPEHSYCLGKIKKREIRKSYLNE